MKIRHERPMSDLSFQVRAPLGLELSTGDMVTISEWSLEGLTFPGEVDVLPREAILSIPFQGVDIRFPVALRPQGRDGLLAFEGLTGRQRETLAVFYRSILSGKMASTEDVITSLDTPVDLVPMGETEEEKSAGMADKSPRGLRAGLTLAFYTCLALLVTWVLSVGIYSKVSVIEISNARIEAPLTDYRATQSGFVDKIAVDVGDHVAAGDVLVHVTTPEREAAVDAVRGRIRLQERRLRDAEARLADLLSTGHEALSDEVRAAQGQVDLLQEELRLLRRERGQLVAALDALNIVAASDGIIRDIFVLPGQALGRSGIVAEVESDRLRVARGWVAQSMASAMHVGMPVTVEVSGDGGLRLAEAYISDVQAGIDKDLNAEFGLLLTVTFNDLSLEDGRRALPHLMPVSLTVRRGWARRLSGWGSGLFSVSDS